MKRKPKVFFNPIGGSAPLSIYWQAGPYGNAIEAQAGNGVYWQSSAGELLGVQFDDVDSNRDDQRLVIEGGRTVTVSVREGKVDISLLDDVA